MHDRQMDDKVIPMSVCGALLHWRNLNTKLLSRVIGMANLVFSTGTLKSSLLIINSNATKKGCTSLIAHL